MVLDLAAARESLAEAGLLRRCGIGLLRRTRGLAASMSYARAHVAVQALGLQIARLGVFASPIDIRRRATVPCLEGISIVLPHLLLGGKAVGDLSKTRSVLTDVMPPTRDNEHPSHLADRFRRGG